MECPICLDPLLPQSIVGRVHHCGHTYHKNCVLEWSNRSNLCPTCRKVFNAIDFVSHTLPTIVVQTITVQNRVNQNDAIDNIPREYVLTPLQQLSETVRSTRTDLADVSSSGVCLICSSAQYSSAVMHMATCVGCGAKFHHSCLGRSSEPSWFCPVCDCHQEFPYSAARRTCQPNTRRITSGTKQQRPHLQLTGDSELFDDGFRVATRCNVMNGGVLLRREAKALANLTPEEAKSWELFEQARAGGEDVEHYNIGEEKVSRKKRPNRHIYLTKSDQQEKQEALGQNLAEMPTGPSRINSLLNQIRSSR